MNANKLPEQSACSRWLFPIILLLTAGWLHNSHAQITVDNTLTASQLLDSLATGSACSQFSNVQVSGAPGNRRSYGFFANGGGNFPLQSGIVLSSGFAASAAGPNDTSLSESAPGWGGDADLESALGISGTSNATVLEFDFIPFNNHISFRYLFASEEYTNDWTTPDMCDFSDGFAFLLRPAAGTGAYQNLAVIPGTTTPVRVTSVRGQGFCPAANEAYFDAFNGLLYPTDFNGQTVVLTAEADVVAGTTYHIKLVIADQGDDAYDSAIFLEANSFNAGINLGPDRLRSTNNPLCDTETLPLDATTPGATGYKWFKGTSSTVLSTSPTFTVQDAGIYRVEAVLSSSCTITEQIKIEKSTIPNVPATTLLQCDDDNDGLARFDLTQANAVFTGNDPDLSVAYYLSAPEAQSASNPIPQTQAYQNISPNQLLHARITSAFGCYSLSTLTLATAGTAVNNPAPITQCDDADGVKDGIMRFDLTQKNAEILQGLPAGLQLQYYISQADALAATNPIANPAAFTNTISGSQTVYARVTNGADCYGVASLTLNAFIFGQQLQPETRVVCTNGTITLSGGNFSSFSWAYNGNVVSLQPELIVTQPGVYLLTVTNALGCSGTKEFNVQLSGAAENVTVETVDFAEPNNTITISAQGPGHYEYSLNGQDYQGEPVFTGLASGEYTVYVRDTQGCLPVVHKTAYILDYPRFFTPNGDGQNDMWRVPYLFMHPAASVTIFNRYGKTLATLKGNTTGWNGTHNGRPLPADDYWFVIEMEDGRTIKGHFAILR